MYELLTIIIFFLYNVANAHFDADRIKAGKRIYHGINGAAYIALLCLTYYLFKDPYMISALLVERALVFNISLNLYRGLPVDYKPLKPKSIVDKVVNKVPVFLLYAVYMAAFILLICKIYLWTTNI